MKQENIKLCLLTVVFILYLCVLSAYTAGSLHTAVYLTGVLVGLSIDIAKCLRKPEIDDTYMSYGDVFRYLAAERE